MSKPPTPRDQCFVAQETLTSLGAQARSSSAGPAYAYATATSSEPRYLDRIDAHFHLTQAERKRLEKNRFVVLDRLPYLSYAAAFHDIFQEQLPLYVGIDPILHAAAHETEGALTAVERTTLAPALVRMLKKMRATLRSSTRLDATTKADLDVYLGFAWHYAKEQSNDSNEPADTLFGHDSELAPLLTASGIEAVELFGRARMVDFSQYAPRGHYASRARLGPYFRAAVWLSRLEFNLASRSSRSSAPGAVPDPRETPREALVALALADLATRSGALRDVDTLDRAWGVLAGRREDVSVQQLTALRAEAGIASLLEPDAFERLRRTVGDRFQRTARVHFMPQGAAVLPAIATFLGPRIAPDTAMTRPLVHDAVTDRFDLGFADVAYALGHDRARDYLAPDLAAHPELAAGLTRARAIAAAPLAGDDLYTAWFAGVRALAERPEGALPSFMDTTAFADLRINSVVAAYGQLRHNYVLMAGQSYDAFGCRIPDAYVEPTPAVYDALISYAARGEAVVATLAEGGARLPGERAYFARLGAGLRVLRAIVRDELANRPLSPEARRYLGLVVEAVPGGSDGGPTYTGWYFDLFRRRVEEGLGPADFIADYYTSSNTGQVAYLGATAPRMGFFVVDTGGAPRLFVGPVARAYDHHADLSHRLTDEDARGLRPVNDPWAASYTAPAPGAPPMAITVRTAPTPGEAPGSVHVVLRGARALGTVTVEFLDHHAAPLGHTRRAVGPRAVTLTVPAADPDDPTLRAEFLAVRVGAFRDTIPLRAGSYYLGAMPRGEPGAPASGAPAPRVHSPP